MSLRGPGVLELFFGDGSDGNVVITGSVAMTRDTYYNTLVMSASTSVTPFLATNSYKLFARNKIIFVTSGTIDNSGISSTSATGTVHPIGTLGAPSTGGMANLTFPGQAPQNIETWGGTGGQTSSSFFNDYLAATDIKMGTGFASYPLGFAVSADGTRLIVVGTQTSLLSSSYSTDSGVTFTGVTQPSIGASQGPMSNVIFASGNTAFAAGGNSGFGQAATGTFSTNGGASWTSAPTFSTAFGRASEIPRALAFGSGVLIAISPVGRGARSTDNGQTWTGMNIMGNNQAAWLAYSEVGNSKAFVCVGRTPGTLFSGSLSTDLGVTWTPIAFFSGNFPAGQLAAFSGNFFSFDNNGGTYRSSDFGMNWSYTGNILPIASYPDAFVQNNGTFYYAKKRNSPARVEIGRSSDLCVTWQTSSFQVGASALVLDMAVAAAKGYVLVYDTISTVYRTFDLSTSFSSIRPNATLSGSLFSLATYTGLTFASSSDFSINGGVGGYGGVGLSGTAGGGGGGVLFIAAREMVSSGSGATLKAAGGNGGDNLFGGIPGSGGGGGVIVLITGRVTGSWTVNVSGGLGGLNNSGVRASSGSTGSIVFFHV